MIPLKPKKYRILASPITSTPSTTSLLENKEQVIKKSIELTTVNSTNTFTPASSSRSLSRTNFDSNQKAFNQLRISCKSLHKTPQAQNYMKENIETASSIRTYIDDMKIPTGVTLMTKLSSRDLQERLPRSTDVDELGKE